MSDTTTITPEAKAILRDVQGCAMGWEPDARLLGNSRADEIYTAIEQALTVLEAAEARADELEGSLSRAISKQSEMSDGLEKVAAANHALTEKVEKAEAERDRLRAERDWLAENIADRPCAHDSCPFGLHRPTGPDDDDCDKTRAQCWKEAALRAVAAGEG